MNTYDKPNAARFAVYALPAGSLGAAGASWLGWDAARGLAVDQPSLPGLPRPLPELTHTARRYGFHATLKAPMRLAEGATGSEVLAALRRVAGSADPIACDLRLGSVGDFLAFLPSGDPQPLHDLAAIVVRDLDNLRAPLTEAEIIRRKPAALSARQNELLHRFGYPYVMDQFQPHFTLTDRLTPVEQQLVTDAAARHFEDVPTKPYRLDTLALMIEGDDGFFRLAGTAGLGAA